ncbi:MAG TPA: helix-turn-helix domain-containing protein [Syntrophomonadaceae bacterium]|nr:helix-turn-helix domain-containing protein [Syntrophomonadaceae bacterium]HPR92946.1 helix-turn-helix domain-containing protein [Syntrophomonadaceae bacterium]
MELLTVEEVASYLKMNPEVIRRWLRENRLPGIKVGKEWRISKEDLENMLDKLKKHDTSL